MSARTTLPQLGAYRPEPALRVAETVVERARVPAVDVHNHLGRWLAGWVGRAGDWTVEDPGLLVALMDELRVAAIVNLDGRWGAELEANLDRYDRAHPGRFVTFCHVDWAALARGDAPDRLAASLRESAERGARGLKVWKDLGLGVRDADGRLVLPDDPRLAPIWDAAGAAGLPVLIHTADPIAFWAPLDDRNERLEELLRHPEWWHGHGATPPYERLIEALAALVGAHPQTTFIGAHVASTAEDLARAAALLAALPNLYVDISARIAELGRQPRAARELIARHPTRVLFGTDAFPPSADAYRVYFRALETADEHFAYGTEPDDPWPQGRWRISGLDLPPALLAGVYSENARRLIRIEDACF